MKFRLATMMDLLRLKEMYRKIVHNMNSNGIEIWDDIYPAEFLADDINKRSLYVLINENNDILGAFALYHSNSGENHVEWECKDAKAVYIDRLGVNVDFCKQGIGTALLDYAIAISKQESADYLRLFVIDINKPAINLYLKSGFKPANGTYIEVIDENLAFHEYGFEKKL